MNHEIISYLVSQLPLVCNEGQYRATENPLFATALKLLNTARKYYSDLLARRVTPKPEEAQLSVN